MIVPPNRPEAFLIVLESKQINPPPKLGSLMLSACLVANTAITYINTDIPLLSAAFMNCACVGGLNRNSKGGNEGACGEDTLIFISMEQRMALDSGTAEGEDCWHHSSKDTSPTLSPKLPNLPYLSNEPEL